MPRRKRRCGAIAHKRAWHSRAPAPRGKPWTRLDIMFGELRKQFGHGMMRQRVYRTLLQIKAHNLTSSKFKEWRGSAIAEYVWDTFLRENYQMDYETVVEHVDGNEFSAWLTGWYDRHGKGPQDTLKIPGGRCKIRPQGDGEMAPISQKEHWKARGDLFRDNIREAAEAQETLVEKRMAEADLEDVVRLATTGKIRFDADEMKAELERRARDRESERMIQAALSRKR